MWKATSAICSRLHLVFGGSEWNLGIDIYSLTSYDIEYKLTTDCIDIDVTLQATYRLVRL